MPLGDLWTEGEVDSASRKNVKQPVVGTGDYIQSLDKTKFKFAACTTDSTDLELIADHFYMVNAAEDGFIDLTQVEDHEHTGSGDGGLLTNIFIRVPTFNILQLTKTDDLKKAQWIETVTGTGSIEDSTDGTTGERSIRLRPNGTSGSGATISYPYLRSWFGGKQIYQTKLQIETATSIALHSGVGADDVTAADSNTRKYQAEVCTATNNNYWLRTATGSANSASDSGIAISANRVAVKIVHLPGDTETDLYIDSGAVLQKTTNIPTDGQTAYNNIIKHSVKNSTGADRPLKMYGCRLSFKTDDNWI